jgi:hypothetical protein
MSVWSCVNSGRWPSRIDIVLFALVMTLAIAWTSALNPEFIGIILILAVALLILLAVILTSLVTITGRLAGYYDRVVHLIVRNRKEFMPARWREVNLNGARGVLQYLVSVLFFFLVFLAYFAVMVAFFYGAGGEPFSDPYRLTGAAFLGTLAVHFSGQIKLGNVPRVVFDFLVPFGVIVGLLDFQAFGSFGWLLAEWLKFGPAVFLFFAAYYGLDVIVEWYVGRVQRPALGGEHAPEEGPGGSEKISEPIAMSEPDRPAETDRPPP